MVAGQLQAGEGGLYSLHHIYSVKNKMVIGGQTCCTFWLVRINHALLLFVCLFTRAPQENWISKFITFSQQGLSVAERSKAPDREQRFKVVGLNPGCPCQQFFNPGLQKKTRHPQSRK